ncbi:HeH/LEM domain-containing protein [Clostridium sp. UBA1652]|uniref:HeH/LEM domain-containing protein n=1 Tax=Clostridium sp. UBA1652 TaxID=1946348 RepID=UPI00257C807E|nr:HeH/LEM domain-containing protein [Clostridium sp. UBA1652]
MYEIKFKDDNKYTGEYGPVMFIDGLTKTNNEWLAGWFEGNGFIVNKIEDTVVNSESKDGYTQEDEDLNNLTMEKLKEIVANKGIEVPSKIKKEELIKLIEEAE